MEFKRMLQLANDLIHVGAHECKVQAPKTWVEEMPSNSHIRVNVQGVEQLSARPET